MSVVTKTNWIAFVSLAIAVMVCTTAGQFFLVASAQEPSMEDASTSAAEAIQSEQSSVPIVFDNPAQNARIASLRELYSQQIEAYRSAERQYQLAKAQHQKLQSLISLEAGVQATQLVMQRRADVMITYLDLLYATLQDTLGLDLAAKDAHLQRLEATIVLMREHRLALETANNRDALIEVTTAFEELYEQVTADSEKTRSMIAIGRMQLVYDKAQIIRSDIRNFQKEYTVSALKNAERERAYSEIEKQFQSTNDAMRKLQLEVFADTGSTSYSATSSKLVSISSSLSRVLSYLEEALRI